MLFNTFDDDDDDVMMMMMMMVMMMMMMMMVMNHLAFCPSLRILLQLKVI